MHHGFADTSKKPANEKLIVWCCLSVSVCTSVAFTTFQQSVRRDDKNIWGWRSTLEERDILADDPCGKSIVKDLGHV